MLVSRDEAHGGDAVFVGTRVPVDTLVDYLGGGYNLEAVADLAMPKLKGRKR